MGEGLLHLWESTGLYNFTAGQVMMIAIGCVLIFLAIRKGFEPLLLIPIGFGGILANIPGAGMALSAVENAVYAGDPAMLAAFADALGMAVTAGPARATHNSCNGWVGNLSSRATPPIGSKIMSRVLMP